MSKRIVLMYVVLTMVVSLAGISASAIDLSSLLPFLYQGSNYVPLSSTASFLGAPLRWDADTGQAIMTYNGQDLALTPNSRNATYAGRSITLSGQPIVVNVVTYVPVDTFKKYYNVPVEWDRNKSEMRMKGSNGWRTWKTSSRPPWHGGPPPWAPAWGRRGNGTPGQSSNVKANGNRKLNAWGQRGYVAPGQSSKVMANGNAKAKAWGQRGYVAPTQSSKVRANGNAKAKGNKKGR